jgi:large subunit ribosomal protein L24
MSVGLKKEDTVQVIAGKHKGKKGRVLAINTKKGSVLIEKVNIIKKHMKPSKTYSQGGIIEKEAAINRSNVMLVCPKCGEPTKVGITLVQHGEKHRTCKKCKEVID